MPDEKLQGAIDVLVDQVNNLLLEVAEKKRVVNSLCNAAGIDPYYGDVDVPGIRGARTIRPDQFYGKPFSTAAQEFLEMRRDRGACSAEEITRGLEQGGFDFQWKEKDKVRNVAISLAKNTYVFAKLPNNTFGLLTWYPEIQKRRDDAAKRGNKGGLGLLNEQESGAGAPAEDKEKDADQGDPEMNA